MLIHVSLHPVALKGVVPTNYPATTEPYGLRRPKSTNARMANCFTRRQRPSCRRTAEQRDEVAAPSYKLAPKPLWNQGPAALVSSIRVRSAHGNSFDYLVGEREQIVGDTEAKRLGGG